MQKLRKWKPKAKRWDDSSISPTRKREKNGVPRCQLIECTHDWKGFVCMATCWVQTEPSGKENGIQTIPSWVFECRQEPLLEAHFAFS